MKVLYIADNRDRHNYGCRATSAALSQLISENHQITGRISGRLTLSNEFVYCPLAPTITNAIIYKIPYLSRVLLKIKHLLHKQLGDFLSTDFDKSIQRLIDYSKCNTEYKELNLDCYDYDAVVINGEGTMIMSDPPRRDTLYYLLFAFWAKKRGKKVYFVNALFSDCPRSGCNADTLEHTRSVLSKCDVVAARDPLSYKYAVEKIKLGTNCKFVPDALFSWYKVYDNDFIIKDIKYFLPYGYEDDEGICGLNLLNGYVCVSGSSAAAWDTTTAIPAYVNLVSKIKDSVDIPVIVVSTCNGDGFLEEVARKTDSIYIPVDIPIMLGFSLLSHAKVFVSGRYHPSIMASCGGVPCVFLGSNSHKNIGLQMMLKYEAPFEYAAIPNNTDADSICRQISEILACSSNAELQVVEKLSKQATEISEIIR